MGPRFAEVQFIQVKLTKISYIGTLSKVQFIQVKLTKIFYIGTLSKVQFIQVKLTKISYIGTLSKVQFIQVKLTKISYIGTLKFGLNSMIINLTLNIFLILTRYFLFIGLLPTDTSFFTFAITAGISKML